MLIPPAVLIDGVVRALLDAVLPEVGADPARAQLYAAVDVLRNLRDRLEERADLLEAEADSAADGLALIAPALRASGTPGAHDVARALAAVPAGPPSARADALRDALGRAAAALHALPPDAARTARDALARHLAAQARRDAAHARPSMLAEISRGRAQC